WRPRPTTNRASSRSAFRTSSSTANPPSGTMRRPRCAPGAPSAANSPPPSATFTHRHFRRNGDPMRATDLSLLYHYHFWATHLILDKADSVTAEQFTTPTRFPMGSLHQTLVHTLATEIYLLGWWQEKPRQPRLTAEDLPDVAAIRARWIQLETDLRAYL